MLPKNLSSSATTLLAIFMVLGLAFSFGCQSSPEPEEDPTPTEPAEPEEPQEPAEEPGAEEADPMAPEAGEVDDETLDQFVDAVINTASIEESAEERMAEAETPEEAQQVEMEIIAEMEEAIEASGLTFEEYVQIAQQLQTDPELLERFRTRLEERGAGHLLEEPGM